jgi:AAA ATPase containing von Willebrand factor type A (vWA) domain
MARDDHDRAGPAPRAGRRGPCERVFEEGGENHGRDQRVEEPAEHAPHRDQEVELGQVPSRRARESELAVAGEGDEEQQEEVPEHGDPDALPEPGDDEEEDGENDGDGGRHHEAMKNGRPPAEGEDETQEIDGEGHHPEQGHGRDVGGDVGGGADHEARRHEGEGGPAKVLPPARGGSGGLAAIAD